MSPLKKSFHYLSFIMFFAAAASPQVRNPLPVPDIPGYKTLKCDFHMHTVFSDGQVWPVARLSEAWRDGLDAIAISDHSGGGRNRAVLKPDLNVPHQLASPLARQLGLLLVPAVEVAQGLTHCNALFIKDANEVDKMELLPALRKLRAQGAFILWNHPGWRRAPVWYPDIDAAHKEGLIDGFEIVNDKETYPETFAWAEEKKLTLFANSDVHATLEEQSPGERRQITLVFVRTSDLQGLREALDSRRTAAWYRDDVWGSEEHLQALWQGAVTMDPLRFAFSAEERSFGLRMRNSSAIPFRVRVKDSPGWLEFGAGEIPPERIVFSPLRIGKEAPAGHHRIDLELEVTNLHVAPGRNLVVRLPLEIGVSR